MHTIPLPLIAGVIAMAIRMTVGAFIIVLTTTNPEWNTVALFDLPTVGLYFLGARVLGLPLRIMTAADPVYFIIGSATWFALAAVLTRLLQVFLRRR